MDQAQALAALAQAHGESLAGLSRLIGRNAAYLQQFVTRGSPRRLAEADRRMIAAYLGVPETALGGEPAPVMVRVPRIDAAASAGAGALVEHDREAGGEAIDPAVIRRLGADPGQLSIVTARGDSMLPTIADGDELLVDRSDRRVLAGGGLFVARVDGALVVKRLVRQSGALVALSDNPAYPPIAGAAIEPLGRVVRLTRRPR